MTIKHLVIGGGGPGGFIIYGALKESNLQGIWKYDDIKTIYATSAGAFIAAVYAMTRDTKTIESIVRRHSKNNHELRDPQFGRVGLSVL